MSRRHRARRAPITLEPFRASTTHLDPVFIERMRTEQGWTPAEIEAWRQQTVLYNDRYQVYIRDFTNGIGQKMLHLSIKHSDRSVIDDWRELQAIKNAIAGPERDAVQVFPREANLMDSANQYHLWVYMDDDFELPFGYKTRQVLTSDEAARQGAQQRSY